jgi:predicted CoA-substrate-specific enzyme activase
MALRVQRWRDQRKLAGLRPRPDSSLNPPLRCVAFMKEMMSRHYLEGRYASGVRPVAWVTSGAPIEVLKALGFFLVYPENHAALCGVRRQAESLSEEAEHAGYSRDICSYARTDIGAMLSDTTPVGRLPRPDLLLCCTNICQTVLYWYRVLADHFRCPLVLIDTPFLYGEARPHQTAHVQRQLEEMIPLAERVAGRALEDRKLREVLERSRRATDLWLEIMDRSQHRPAPMTAFDGFIHMGPIVDLRGDMETIEYYGRMLAELDERIQNGVGAVKEERHRVLWDNLPIWFKIGDFSKWLGERGVNVVVSTYTYAWGELAPFRVDGPRVSASHPESFCRRQATVHATDGRRLQARRCDPPFRSLVQALLARSDRPAGPPGQRDRRAGLAARGRSQRSTLLFGRAGYQPAGGVRGDDRGTRVSRSEVAAIGIDAGSTTCKLVAVDRRGGLLTSSLEETQPQTELQVRRMLDALLSGLGQDDGVPTVATGYGRKLIQNADRNVTEITCHARGIFRDLGRGGTLVDIGGQDSKVIRVGNDGTLVDFIMNDKCAAGTGRFLEHTAARLRVPIEELGRRALATEREEPISSTCTVFAESEIVSLIARGVEVEAILRGLHRALVARLVAMVRSVGLTPPLMLSGGVALDEAVRAMMEEATGERVLLPSEPQLMGAYGAALLGAGLD